MLIYIDIYYCKNNIVLPNVMETYCDETFILKGLLSSYNKAMQISKMFQRCIDKFYFKM